MQQPVKPIHLDMDTLYSDDFASCKPVKVNRAASSTAPSFYTVTDKQEVGRRRNLLARLEASGYNECSRCTWPIDQCLCVGTSYAKHIGFRAQTGH